MIIIIILRLLILSDHGLQQPQLALCQVALCQVPHDSAMHSADCSAQLRVGCTAALSAVLVAVPTAVFVTVPIVELEQTGQHATQCSTAENKSCTGVMNTVCFCHGQLRTVPSSSSLAT